MSKFYSIRSPFDKIYVSITKNYKYLMQIKIHKEKYFFLNSNEEC